ncbi:MAG TPA: hypothetical protein VF829_01975 [Candidatus Paceibacterota bacterium]
MKGTRSVVFWSALGALIGTLCAAGIQQYFAASGCWFLLGVSVGGLFAYVGVDFKRFWMDTKRAWYATVNWKPNNLYWRAVVSGAKAISLMAFLAGFLCVIIIWPLTAIGNSNSVFADLLPLLTCILGMCGVLSGGACLFVIGILFNEDGEFLLESVRVSERAFARLNNLPEHIWSYKKRIWEAIFRFIKESCGALRESGTKIAKTSASFTVLTLRYTHRREREVTAISATLGGLAGGICYHMALGLFWSVLCGTFAGGIIALVWCWCALAIAGWLESFAHPA